MNVKEAASEAWSSTLRPRWIIALTFIVMAGTILGTKVWDAFTNPPVFFLNSQPVVSQFGDYIGVTIDRTRNSLCNLHSSRVLFRSQTVNGETLPVILPLPQSNFMWPKLGRFKFVLLIPIPKDLPPGVWYTQTTAIEDCHWYSWITGGSIIVSPKVAVTIPAISEHHQ